MYLDTCFSAAGHVVMPEASGTIFVDAAGAIALDVGCGVTDLGVSGFGGAPGRSPNPGMVGRGSPLMLELLEERLLDSFKLSSIARNAGFVMVSILLQHSGIISGFTSLHHGA
jgi:hypothetical protein